MRRPLRQPSMKTPAELLTYLRQFTQIQYFIILVSRKGAKTAKIGFPWRS